MTKETGEENPYYESKSEFNQPSNPKYGTKSTMNAFCMTVKEVFEIYDKYINLLSEVANIDNVYRKDEEVAFKNAIVLHTKKFYQVSYEIRENFVSRKFDYFSTLYDQKPHATHVIPLIENLYLNECKELAAGKKYFFSFLFDPIAFNKPEILNLKIDKRFAQDLIREAMQIRLNKIGIHTRSFYSSDIKRIFMVLKCQDAVLRITAEVSPVEFK